MLPAKVIDQTLAHFPALTAGGIEVSPLEKGGSDRKFYRVQAGREDPLIVVKYSGHKEENRHYVDIARFLEAAGVNVPRIYFHDPDEGLIWMQDLGEVDLWNHRSEPWTVRRPLYESALTQVAALHGAARRVSPDGLRLEREFNDQLYLWEQGYFFENCLGAHFGLPESEVRRYAALPVFHDLARRLAARPRVLVHRDFQSQNILIRAGEAWLIDFQGMRPGLAAYDVASLLFDPYVEIAPTERDELLDFYKRTARQGRLEIADDFDDLFHECALQRLMQALGAYGFLGLKKGRPEFLTHIPAARRSLREVAAHLDGLDDFLALLDSLP